MTVNAHTEIPVNATVIEKAITKVKDQTKEIAKAENIEEGHAHRVASVTFSAAITINLKCTDKHTLVSIFLYCYFHLNVLKYKHQNQRRNYEQIFAVRIKKKAI